MSHTALVNVDADAASKLSAFIAELTGDSKDEFSALCESQQSQPAALLQTLLSKTDLILALEDVKDAEGCFQALVAILHTVADSTEEQAVIQCLIKSLSANSNSLLVLRVFVSVFNLLRTDASKFSVLKGLLSYATNNGRAGLVTKFESHVADWVVNWALTVSEQRELYLLVADTLFATEQHARALFFLTQFMATFSTGESYPPDVVTVASKAVVCAIKAPVSMHKDRNNLSTTMVGRVTTDATLLKLIELLGIFCVGTVDQYTAFHNSNKDLFAKFEVCHETSVRSMRLLGLCALAARSTTSAASSSQLLSYSDIAKALEVSSDEEVEEWVVEAISHGLMDASMDQLSRTIVVSRCVRVSFDREEWVTLQGKLAAWKNNLTSVLEVMRSHQKTLQ